MHDHMRDHLDFYSIVSDRLDAIVGWLILWSEIALLLVVRLLEFDTHKHGSQWVFVVDIDDSWSTVGVEYASRWDLSTLIERSSPMGFERLSPKICDHSSVIDRKEFL